MAWEKTERKLHRSLKGGNALLEETSYGRSCIGGLHVFRMAYLTICCVLLCFAERYVLLEDKFFLRVCIIGGHVLQFYTLKCPTFYQGYVL